MPDLKQFLAEIEAEVQQQLELLLPPEEGPEARLYAAMRYSALAGGKRLRPALFAATLAAFGQSRTAWMPFAAALEMIHTYSLIHDDLPAMDNDDFRRGRPSCHRAFDEASAILAGDALLTHAFAVMLSVPAEPERLCRAVALVARLAGCGGMVAGQAAELASSPESIDRPRLDEIYRGKTGALLACAVLSAAHLCGAGERELAALELYSYQSGRAFQIIDDVLDVQGDSALLGKNTGSDVKNKTRTYASLLGCYAARAEALLSAEKALQALEIFDTRSDLLRSFPEFFVSRDH
ncbi:MAG: polyprenyl synthetase family protein [Bacillota bacterium]|nr:polyprenyl synthetase family protein [Bacillota bacterium]